MSAKMWHPPPKPVPMTVFTWEAWLRPRLLGHYGGGDIHAAMSQHKDQLRRELELATDDQLREEGKRLHSMHQYKARLVFEEAQRRGLIEG